MKNMLYFLIMEISKKRNFIWNVLFAACIAAIIYLAFAYCIPVLAPFLIAFIVTALITPLVDLLNRKLRIPKKLSAIVLVTVSYLLLIGLVILIGFSIYRWAVNADGWFRSEFVPQILAFSERLSHAASGIGSDVAPFLADIRDKLISLLGTKISEFSANVLTGAASSLPSFLIASIFAIVATFFMATDTDRLRNFIATRQTEDLYSRLSAAYLSLKKTLGKYIRAYFLIFLITFSELTVGFLCAGVENFVLMALFVAVFDILPILGSSMIVLPWSIFLLISGDYRRGIIMFFVYLIVVVVRQFIEPKIVGEHVGLHPLITLMAMYIGAKLFGGVGLFGFPIVCAVIVQLQNAGFMDLFPKRREADVSPEPERSFFKKKASKGQ